MKKLLLFSLTVFCIIIFEKQNLSAQTQQWAVSYDNPGMMDYLYNTSTDNSGNVYITGVRTSSEGRGQFLAKYNSTGNFQWQRFFNGPYANIANNRGAKSYSSVIDNSGNILIAGSVDSAFSLSKGYIMKYSPNGDSLWGTYAGINDTLGYVEWYSIKLDNSGNIYTAGYSFKINPFRSTFVIAKYSSAGILQWVKGQRPVIMRTSNQVGFSMQMDNTNNIYVAATIQRNDLSTSTDFYAFKMNSSGALIWETSYNGPADAQDNVTSMGIDLSGNVYVEGTGMNVNPNMKEITCVRFNSTTGTQDWVFRTNGTNGNGDENAYKMAVGQTNDVYLTGSLFDGTSDYGVLIKLNAANGNEAWRKVLKSTPFASNLYSDVKVLYSGFIYAAGTTDTYSPNCTAHVRKFNLAGDSLYSASYPQPWDSYARSILPGPGNSLILSGDNRPNATEGSVYVVKYSVTTGIESNTTYVLKDFSLSQNYPNPFNPSTKISFNIPKDSKISLSVYDINGKLVKSLINNVQYLQGNYSVNFIASDIPSGTYFYKLSAEGFSETKKMLLIK